MVKAIVLLMNPPEPYLLGSSLVLAGIMEFCAFKFVLINSFKSVFTRGRAGCELDEAYGCFQGVD